MAGYQTHLAKYIHGTWINLVIKAVDVFRFVVVCLLLHNLVVVCVEFLILALFAGQAEQLLLRQGLNAAGLRGVPAVLAGLAGLVVLLLHHHLSQLPSPHQPTAHTLPALYSS